MFGIVEIWVLGRERVKRTYRSIQSVLEEMKNRMMLGFCRKEKLCVDGLAQAKPTH